MTTPIKKKEGFNTLLYISTPKYDINTLTQEEETDNTSSISNTSRNNILENENEEENCTEKKKDEFYLTSELLLRLEQCSPVKSMNNYLKETKEEPFKIETNYLLEFYHDKKNEEENVLNSLKNSKNNFMRKINFSEKENSNLNLVNNAVNVSKKFNEMCLNKDDMKNFFLKNSKGKSQKIKNGKNKFLGREGDWKCFNCKNINFAFRKNCNRCNFFKEESQKKSENVQNNFRMIIN